MAQTLTPPPSAGLDRVPNPKPLAAMRRAAAMALVMLIALAAPAQQGISYQAALRNAQGEPMANREVRLRLTLREGATDRYAETQTVTTTALGLINVVVGEGTPVSGDFGQLDWSHQYDLVVEIDAELSGSYTQLQASALHPVPQAQWARVASELQMPESRGLTLQPKPTAQLHEDSVLFGVRNKNGDLVFAVYNSGVAVYVDDRDNGSRPQRAGFMVGGMDGTRDGTQRTLFAVDGTGTQVLVDEGTGGRPQRAGFRVGGMDGTRDGERAQRNLFEVDASGTRVHVDGRDATGRPQRAGFMVGGMDGTRAGSTLLTVDSSGTSVFIDDATTAGRPQRAGFRVGGMDGTRASQPANYFVVTSDSTRVYVDERNRPQRAGFAVGGMDGTRAGDSRYMDITRDNYIIGHGAGKALMSGTATGKNNSIMGTNAAPKMEGNSNVAIGNQAGNAVITGDYNVFVGANSARLPKKTSQTVAIGYQAGEGQGTSDYTNGVFVGFKAGYYNTQGNDNVFVGSKAGNQNRNGSNNVVMGNSAAQSTQQMTNSVIIGNQAGVGSSSSTHVNEVFIGNQAGKSNTTGENNVFIGNQTGLANTEGGSNVFVGNQAGAANTTASNNVFMGTLAGVDNRTGYSNVYMGHQAGAKNTHQSRNVFIGDSAGYGNGSSNNVYIGYRAGRGKNAGSNTLNNVVIGCEAGDDLGPFSQQNVIIGKEAGKNITGTSNIFIGLRSGFSGSASGGDNVCIGSYTGSKITSGKMNTVLGYYTGNHISTGNYNTVLGAYAGWYNESGNNNTNIGYYAGFNNKTGSSNVFIGYKAGYNETGSNMLYIANSDSKTLIKGNFSTGEVWIQSKLYANGAQLTSDKRLKTDIRPLENALAKVMKLNGVSYKWRTAEFKNRGFDENRHAGVLAQEVEAVLPEAVVTGEDGYKSVSYNDLVPLLIEGMKEQQHTIEKQQKSIEQQQQQIDELKKLVEQLMKK